MKPNANANANPVPAGIARRPVLLAMAAGATGSACATAPRAPADLAAQLVARAEQKNAAFMNGRMHQWLELAHVAPDFTLMQPFGGGASHGFDTSPESLQRMSARFRRGQTSLEVARVCTSDELAVLVMIECQRAEVGGLPEQDWSLRVTEVYRRDGNDWQLLHRHADPLVRPRTLAQTAALARGDEEAASHG